MISSCFYNFWTPEEVHLLSFVNICTGMIEV